MTADAPWRRRGDVALVLTGLTLVVFLISWAQSALPVSDAVFAVLVAVNAGIAYGFWVYLRPRLALLFDSFAPGPSGTAAAERIYSGRWAVPFGILYAAVIAVAVWVIDPMQAGDGMRAVLAAFIFCGNLMIGFGFVAVVTFWRLFLGVLPQIDFRILNLSRPELVNLTRVNSLIVICTAIIVSLSLIGMVLSSFEKDITFIGFSVFTLAVLIGTYAVPIVPLSERLRALKAEELSRLETIIEGHVRALSAPAGDPMADKRRADIDDVLKARDVVRGISTMPPNGEFSISTAAIVAFLSFLPSIVDFVMKTFR